MTDLELLELAERARDGRKGERGAQGVSIREIRSTSPTEIVITLTDGRSFNHTFPKPADGEPGAAGKDGNDGASSTVAGPRGPAGSPGRDGRDAQGAPGTSVDSVLVSEGQLLVGLTDGQIIRAGTVVGPSGASGERGATGLSGARGDDGNTILSGEKPPNDAEDGKDGDFYIDLSSPQYDFFGPKRGGAWGGRRTFLKQPPAREPRPARSMPVGGGSGGGGGATQKPFRVVLPAGAEVLVGTVSGETAILNYKVTATADNTRWSAGNMNAAANGATADGEAFTLGAELTGVGGDLDLSWRIDRNAGIDKLSVFASSPVNAIVEGRFAAYTDV